MTQGGLITKNIGSVTRSWAIETGAATARPDIALLYYPSLYDFLWMAARTARYLNAKGSATVRDHDATHHLLLCWFN